MAGSSSSLKELDRPNLLLFKDSCDSKVPHFLERILAPTVEYSCLLVYEDFGSRTPQRPKSEETLSLM